MASTLPMRIVYVLLSPTFGMHQYTADLANRFAEQEDGGWGLGDRDWGMGTADSGIVTSGCGPVRFASSPQPPTPNPHPDVHLVTTTTVPRDRYSPRVTIHTPVTTTGTGFAPEGLDAAGLRRVLRTILALAGGWGLEGRDLGMGIRGWRIGVGIRGAGERVWGQTFGKRQEPTMPSTAFQQPNPYPLTPSPQSLAPNSQSLIPTLVHFTGVHLWNPLLVAALRRRGIPVIHTLHDLDPHVGVRFGPLIHLWNRLVLSSASHVLVHGRRYRDRLLAAGVPRSHISMVPLLHLFWSYATMQALDGLAGLDVRHEPWALFFGRLERYKGIDQLLTAATALAAVTTQERRLVLAGPGPLDRLQAGDLPPGIEVRNRLLNDQEALALFGRCGLLVLPYLDATQSALIGAAYYFRKPVLVTGVGALPEYVEEGRTGWVVPVGDARALATGLSQALADPDRLRHMGDAGRAWYDARRREEWAELLAMVRQVSGHYERREP